MNGVASAQRLGLAMSGGGFRASFYHIGVLARMAELGILRHVESISTVSGGSIVGAAYYLLLKELLERKPEADIQDKDYVQLVERLEGHFLEAVQHNLRLLTFANPLKNLRMSRPNYSRSDAIGEVYEKYIYRPLIDVGRRRIQMRDLLIHPAGISGEFHPWNEQVGNPVRRCKVPVLILNASSLNSGHNWTFTATAMGEVPPRNPNFEDFDKKDRYLRARYTEITTRDPDFLLGNAVAASAGVPGIFPPMAVSGLYSDRRVQLVDGGVYDNQGISGLLDPERPCSDFVVSDASGQSDAENEPDIDSLPVLINVSGIMGARVREEMVNGLELEQVDRVAYFHLMRELFARDVLINQGGVKKDPASGSPADIDPGETSYGITREAQRLLAQVRTDLDSFTDVEAGCLQADGYQMSAPDLKRLQHYVASQPTPGNWGFARYLTVLKTRNEQMIKQLELARHQFLKPLLYVVKGACSGARSAMLLLVSLPWIASLIAIFAGIDWALKSWVGVNIWKILTDSRAFQAFAVEIAPLIYLLIVSFVLAKVAEMVIRGGGHLSKLVQTILKGPMAIIRGIFIRALLPVIFAIPIIIYLYTIDRYFIRVMGKLE